MVVADRFSLRNEHVGRRTVVQLFRSVLLSCGRRNHGSTVDLARLVRRLYARVLDDVIWRDGLVDVGAGRLDVR